MTTSGKRMVSARIVELRSNPAKGLSVIGTVLRKIASVIRKSPFEARSFTIELNYDEIAAISAMIDIRLTEEQFTNLIDLDANKSVALWDEIEILKREKRLLLDSFISVWDYAARADDEIERCRRIIANSSKLKQVTKTWLSERRRRRPAEMSWKEPDFIRFDPDTPSMRRIRLALKEHEILIKGFSSIIEAHEEQGRLGSTSLPEDEDDIY